MLHVMPFVNWLNHGFFNFHPIFFTDLAVANNYAVKRLAIGNRWGKIIELQDARYLQDAKRGKSSMIRDAVREVQEASDEENVMVIALFNKKHNDSFHMPIQRKYKNAIEDLMIKQRYAKS